MHRHPRLALLLLLLAPSLAQAILCGPANCLGEAYRQEGCTVAVFGDTQSYVKDGGSKYDRFVGANGQANWTAANVSAQRIGFVTLVGDVVSDGSSLTEWGRADTGMDLIDAAGAAYSVSIGNHDPDPGTDADPNTFLLADYDNFRTYFGTGRYAGKSWYLGADATGRTVNFAQLFNCRGRQFLHVNTEVGLHNAASQAFTIGVLGLFPNLPVLLTNHHYTENGSCAMSGAWAHYVAPPAVTHSSYYSAVVETYPRILAMFTGHYHYGDLCRVRLTTSKGADFSILVVDFQSAAIKPYDEGWTTLVRFSDHYLSDRTYSPYRGNWLEDDVNKVTNNKFNHHYSYKSHFPLWDNLTMPHHLTGPAGEP